MKSRPFRASMVSNGEDEGEDPSSLRRSTAPYALAIGDTQQ
jgi:hypothetical protein